MMKSEKLHRLIILEIFLLWMNIHHIYVYAETPSLSHGKYIEYDQGAWNKALYIEIEEQEIVFYHEKEHERHALLLCESFGRSDVLWEADKLDASWGVIPKATFIAGQLNNRSRSDLLFTYADDCGTGQGSECWTQYLRVFFDIKRSENASIPLSAIDTYLKITDGDHAYLIGERGPAIQNTSLVLILPAWEKESCMVYVWLREKIFEYPPTNTPDSVSYRVRVYENQGQEMTLTETIEGDYADTANRLHAVLQQRKAQQDAPAPIFLNLSDFKQHYVYDETQWFQALDAGE